jgi:HK97 family phage major capsid protein
MDGTELRERLREARVARERLFTELENLKARGEVDGASDGLAERTANINRGIEHADNKIAELEGEYGRYVELRALADDPRHVLPGEPPAPERREQSGGRNEQRDRALRTIERHADRMEAGAADRLDQLVRTDTRRDWTARYLDAVGSDAYKTAFGKLIADPQNGHLRYSQQEVEAVRLTSELEQERTAMAISPGAQGGFALPFTLDPSIMLSSAGAANPVRQIARVVTTAWNEWRGISSDGVTVAYSAEASTMSDNSPVLAQPSIVCQRWSAFVPYSWELGQDWNTLESELVRVIRDGRDVNDATMFYSGTTASNQPNGIMNGVTVSQQVLTVGTAALTAADWWSLKAAIPPRWQSTTTFVAPSPMLDRTYRLVPNASTTEPALMETRDGALSGRPVAEWSFNAGTATATGGTLAIGGDFNAGYVIADRLGLTAVPIPVLFGGTAAVHYPTGQSGLVVWGRTGANVVNANAFRILVGR